MDGAGEDGAGNDMNAFSTPPPMLTFLMVGAVSAGAVYNLWIWLHRRHDTLHLWATGWCAITGAYLVSHYVQLSSDTPERVVLGSRLAWVSVLLIILVLAGLTQTLVRGRYSPRSIRLLGGVSAVLALATLLTNLIATDQIYQRTDWLGTQYWAPVPGPLMILLVPYILSVFVYCFTIVWRAKQLDRGERRAFLLSFSVYIVAGLNDSLHAARYIQSIRVFDDAFVAVALGLTYLAVRRYTRLSAGLETEVAAQTRDLLIRQEQLGALVRAGQVVMAGLDLQDILTRLIGEASRISGAPHVAVLLRDEGSRTLRLAASMGEALPPSHELTVGQSISGLVAERGEPIYIANVADDPRNSIAEQDRAGGIVAYLGLPIRAAGPVLGVLIFKTIEPRVFQADEIAILTSFAHQAAIAIENARLYSALESRVKRLDTLTGLNRLISDSLDVDHILKQIAHAAAALMNAGLVIVWSADEGRQLIHARASSNDEPLTEYPQRARPFGEGVVGQVALDRRPRKVADVEKDGQERLGQWFLDRGFRSGVALPILRGKRLLGALSLVFREPLKPNIEDDPLLRGFIDQAAIAMEHGRLYSNLETRVSQLKTVTRLNRLISSSLDSDRVLSEITQAAAQLPGAAAAAIWLANEEKRTLEIVNFSDPVMDADCPMRTVGYEEGVIGWVARHGRLLNVPDAFKDDRFAALDWWRRHGLTSYLGLPVIQDGVLLAVLTLIGREAFQLDPENERLLESFGDQAALAIRNASLYTAEGAARLAAERALAEVKRLQGMLPICSYCKKIRNDRNSWEQMESYISEHSHATFSHGICPDCRSTVVAHELEKWRRAQ
jgi:GAF domain-containing protein